MNRTSRNKTIDGVKIICAVLVLFLHTINVGRPYEVLWKSIFAIGLHKVVWAINPVEVFFIFSAFFVFISGNGTFSKNILIKYIKRLGVLYLFWSIFYIKNLLSPFGGVENAADIVTAVFKSLRIFFVTGTSGHMWYVLALIYGLIILYPFLSLRNSSSQNDKIFVRGVDIKHSVICGFCTGR